MPPVMVCDSHVFSREHVNLDGRQIPVTPATASCEFPSLSLGNVSQRSGAADLSHPIQGVRLSAALPGARNRSAIAGRSCQWSDRTVVRCASRQRRTYMHPLSAPGMERTKRPQSDPGVRLCTSAPPTGARRVGLGPSSAQAHPNRHWSRAVGLARRPGHPGEYLRSQQRA